MSRLAGPLFAGQFGCGTMPLPVFEIGAGRRPGSSGSGKDWPANPGSAALRCQIASFVTFTTATLGATPNEMALFQVEASSIARGAGGRSVADPA